MKPIHDQQRVAKIDASISMGLANVIALGFIPLTTAIVMVPYWLLWGRNSTAFTLTLNIGDLVPFVFVMVFSVLAHEALHGLGFAWFGQVTRSALHFGIQLKTLTPYTHCQVPMSASGYRLSLALPGIALGALPAALGMALGIGWLLLYGLLMLFAAGGDLAILWAIRSVSPDAQVIDHPERAGCWVLAEQTVDSDVIV